MPRNKVNQPSESGSDEEQETTELIGEEAARCFITQIHQGCLGRPELRTINPTTNSVRQHWPTSLDEAVTIAMASCATDNVYYGACTRRGAGSGKKDNLSYYPGVWLDIDFKDFGGGEKDVCAKLESFPARPTLLVQTGAGAHAYWLLTVPQEITAERIPQLESLNADIASRLGGDACHDLTRILRIPGTTNWPDERKRLKGRVPEPVRLLWHEGPRYTLEHLRSVVPTSSTQPQNKASRQKNHSQRTDRSFPPRFMELLKHNDKIKTTWEGNRQDLKDQSGSGYDMAMTNQLVSHGLSNSEIKTILRAMPSGRGAKAADVYLDRTIGKARPANNREKLLPADLADQFLRDRHLHTQEGLRLRWFHEEWLRHNGKSYAPLPMPDLTADVTAFLQSNEARHKTTKTFVNNVLLNLQGVCVVPSSVSLPVLQTETSWVESPNTLVVDNGILDLQSLLADPTTATLEPHNPQLVSIIALPFVFDASAECPDWLTFLNEILPDEASRQLLCEIFGYCLTNDVSQQKFFLFEGSGANGKGVITNMLSKMLGEANVSNIPLELFASTHGLEVTLGKLVNIVSEIGELDRVAEGLLKMFTGGDAMFFNPKYKTPFSAKPNTKLIITTNVRPPFRDRSEGIWRRLILLPFPVSISETKQNKNLAEDLAGELPGIFNWAVRGYQSLQQRGYFLEPLLSLEAKREFRLESNPALAYLQEHCIADPNAKVVTTVLYCAYESFCKDHGCKPLNDANFGKEVRRSFPQARRIKTGKNLHSHRPWAYQGLRLRALS
ncbi:MAG: phage/plasmid primase, P4 family [Nitrospira sp.]